MNNIHTLVLAPENAKAIMEHYAKTLGANLLMITPRVAQSHEQHIKLKQIINQWDSLRKKPGIASRFNSYQRFLSNITNNKDKNNFQTATVIFKDNKAIAIIRCNFAIQARWVGAGKLNNILPGLKCISFPKTSILTDCSNEAKQLVCNHLSGIIEFGLVSFLQIDSVETETYLHNKIIQTPTLSKRAVQTEQIRWIRKLLDPATKEPVNLNSAKTKSSLRRKLRNLEKEFDGQLEFTQIDQEHQILDFIKKASGIAEQTYQSALGTGIKNTEKVRNFFSELANDGVFRGYLLSGKGEAISYIVGDSEGGIFILMGTSFLPKYKRLSPGLVLLNHVISELTNEGIEILDFGPGEAIYKERYGSTKLDEIDWRIYSTGLTNMLAHKADISNIWLKINIRKLTKKLRLIDTGRHWWRKYLQNRSTSPSR